MAGLGEREWLAKEEWWLILVGLEARESEKLERLLSSENRRILSYCSKALLPLPLPPLPPPPGAGLRLAEEEEDEGLDASNCCCCCWW